MEVKGPLWHKLQVQTTRVVSDLINLKLCEQLGRAIAEQKGRRVVEDGNWARTTVEGVNGWDGAGAARVDIAIEVEY
jgi:hypothetical protein